MIEGCEGTIAFVGVGANLGKPLEQCREALDRMEAAPGLKLLRRSSFYRSEPVGFRDQPWFVNAVAEVRTALAAVDLLKALRGIEAAMGRVRERQGGPRAIDLDLLLYGQEILRHPDLTVPHPRMHGRRFVLIPFCEIASYVIHPAFGVSIQGLLDRLQNNSVVEPMGS